VGGSSSLKALNSPTTYRSDLSEEASIYNPVKDVVLSDISDRREHAT
jgi:hypothetical protein